MHILFVCMGNICRSPVIESVARAHFLKAGLNITVASAGTENYHEGGRADTRSIASAAAYGYDLQAHRAHQVRDDEFAGKGLILAMDNVNLRALRSRFALDPENKISLFLDYAGIGAHEVPDPYYGTARDFEKVIELAKLGVDGLIERLGQAHNMPVTDRARRR